MIRSASISMTTSAVSERTPKSKVTAADDSWCHTRMFVTKHQHRWTIHKFSMRREKTGEKLQSSTFSAEGDTDTKWCLELYNNGYNEESKDYLSLYLRLRSFDSSEVSAEAKLSILDSEGQKTNERCLFYCFSKATENWGFAKFISKDSVMGSGSEKQLLPNDTLTISCSLRVFSASENASGGRKPKPLELPACQMSRDFGKLLEDRKFSDFVLVVNGQEIRAHKNILAARSPVFAAMFEHDLEDQKSGRVEITDLDYEAVREMVRFIYTGRASNMRSLSEGLLAAADKYALERLKVEAERYLCSRLTVENAAKLLTLADRHSAGGLKAAVLDVIVTRAEEVLRTSGWETMIQKAPHLIAEAFRHLAIDRGSPEPCPSCSE